MPKILPLVILLVMLPVSALHARAGWTDYARVSELIATSRHYYEVSLPVSSPSGCREDHWYYIHYDAAGSQQMFAILLDALKSKLGVRIYVTGICNVNGYAEISAVGLRR